MAVKLIDAVYSEFSKDPTTLIKSYVMDSPEDVAALPKSAPGSTAMVAAKNGSIYMVNASGEWKDVSGGGSSGGGESGGESGGGGASVETCTVGFGLESWCEQSELESVTYTALVDGAITTKTVKSTDENFFGTYNDVVKGTILQIKAKDKWFGSSYGAFATYSTLSQSSDNNYTYYNFVINRDGSIDFMMD